MAVRQQVWVLQRTARPRLSRPPSQTWRTFLANHVSALASMDFFTVQTLTGRLLFVFVVLSHDRRRIVHVNCTARPTSAWTAQQLVEAFPDDTAPRDRAVARPRQHLRRPGPPTDRQPRHQGRRVQSVESLAESLRGTGNWLPSARVPESCDR